MGKVENLNEFGQTTKLDQYQINSIVVDKLVNAMGFSKIDNLLVRHYPYNVIYAIAFGLIFGGGISFWVSGVLNFSSYFLYGIVGFGAFSFFLLFLFIYKALMMGSYIKLRSQVHNINEYVTFSKILLKNSYQKYDEKDIDAVITLIDAEHQRIVSGKSLSLIDVFRFGGTDRILWAIMKFKDKKNTHCA